jgi:hypothetical protein
MAKTESSRRLLYINGADLELWGCRSFETVDVLDLKDRKVGRFDGLVIDQAAGEPRFIVVRHTPKWFLVPVGDAWFDQTERAIRIDTNLRRRGDAIPFNPDEFNRMTEDEARDYEMRVLAQCCPEVGLHRDGTPDYSRLAAFQCPAWIRQPQTTNAAGLPGPNSQPPR